MSIVAMKIPGVTRVVLIVLRDSDLVVRVVSRLPTRTRHVTAE